MTSLGAKGAAASGARDVEVFGQDVGQRQFLPDGGLAAFVVAEQFVGDEGAETFELRVVIEEFTVARTGERNVEGRAERRAGAVREWNDAVCEEQRFVDVVGDEDDGLFIFFPDALELVLERRARERVERGERFIEQENLRVHRKRAGDGDALTLAARKFARGSLWPCGVRFTVAMASVMICVRLSAGVVGENLIDREADVLRDGEPRQQRVVLKHDAAIGAGLGDFEVVEFHGAAVGTREPGDERDERGLARAGVADDGDKLAAVDAQVDVAEHGGAAEALGNVGEFEEGHGLGAFEATFDDRPSDDRGRNRRGRW